MSLVAVPFKTGPNPTPSSRPSQKLTKKQKKGLAFRDRKPGKSSRDSKKFSTVGEDQYELAEMDVDAIPAVEDQDLLGGTGGDVQVEAILDAKKGKLNKAKKDKVDKGKGKHQGECGEEAVGDAVQLGKEKKRKREEDVEVEVDVEAVGGAGKRKKKEEEGEGAAPQQSSRLGGKQRFILFVGNFAYTTSKKAIEAHFAACDPPPDVRLLTPKPKPGVPARPKSKGCAFLEFKSKSGLQQALKLHQSMLDGRMINVELTAGGGGKSETRLNKVKERNKGLLTQRQKKLEITSKKPSDVIPSRPDRPQRFSTTSGLGEAPASQKRTWSVGNEVEEPHRAGKKHVRGKKRPSVAAAWGTGVNAIPVG